jgi:hypothetical protein
MTNRPVEHRDVMNYSPPRGPKNITDPKSPGLHGRNFECCGSQERDSLKSESSGMPGLGGQNHPCGSQR